MPRDSRAFLADALDAARSIEHFRRNLDLAGFRADDLVRAAVECKLEIVGEALNRPSREAPELAAGIPDIGRIVAFRNVLAHGYDVVDDEIAWDGITIDLPELTTGCDTLNWPHLEAKR